MTESESLAGDIAIVGLAGRFPGARDASAFWENLAAGRDCITRLSDEQLAATGYDPAKVRTLPGFVAARGLVEKPEWFDRGFFGVPPKEAEVMDPQHRVFLEIAWEALEDAGCDPSRYPGLIGVFAGMSNNTYFPFFVRQRRDLLDAVGIVSAVIANEKDFLTTRLAYKLNLRGPSLNIQTACSSSLVTVCVAAQNLLHHQCDIALAGGVSLTFPQERGYFFQDGGMTSPDGWCRPFDERANGTVFSSGAGVVVLKRLADALADRDHIYAVIKGHALNNDGAQKVGFAAPSVQGHTEVISLAQAVAGVTPDTISYIEAHGTATPLGDPVEIAGLAQVFRATTDARQFCALGSVKGNIGHCDAASGIISLIKMALAFEHGQLPPTIHCEQPNPALHLDESPFFLNTTLRAWPRGDAPRRAGVSSFGVGGTNAHVVLEEAPALPAAPETDAPKLLVLSAKSAFALERRAQDLAAHLESHPVALADAAFTLHEGRQTFTHRRAVVARTAADAIAALRAPAKLHREDDRLDTPVAFLFPGQGSQYPGMGAGLFAHEPVFRDTLTRCAELLRPELGLDLCELLFSREAEAAERLRETRFTQPAIFAVSYALARLWQARGVAPAALVGHSVGEFVAGALAGVFSWEDATRLVALRARLTQALPPGAMLAARLGEEEASEFLHDPRLALAAVNSPKLCVISGPLDAIEALEATCTSRSITARRLATSHAFHSPMVEPVVAPLADALRTVKLSAPQIPIVSSVTGEPLTAAQATDPQYWAHHLRATVRFSAAATRLLATHDGALLESGPGQTLSQLIRQNSARTARHEVAHSIDEHAEECEALAAALGRLWLAGVPLDWSAAHPGRDCRRISLPTYPFERQRYFADLPAEIPMPLATAATDGEGPEWVAHAPRVPLSAPPPKASGATGEMREALATEPLSGGAPATAREGACATEETPLTQLRQLLTELSGIDLSTVPASTSFLDLGFDSLFLSQTALTLSRRFKTKITLRQLLRENGTLETLAAALPNAVAAVYDRRTSPPESDRRSQTATTTAHGPFRPVVRDVGAALTDRQQRWLDDFISRYTQRTPGSKQHTQAHRAHFADPRAAAGFKQVWKEMVYPVVVDRSAGSKLWDIDGNEWTDFTLSFGAAMLGHQPPFVVEAITAQLARGMEIGPTSPLAGEVAALLCAQTGMERATFCNSGSEAVTGALRVARTVTGRPRIAYFASSYHGIDNEVLGRRGPDGLPTPIAPGIPPEAVANALILDYGDPRALEQIAAHAGDIAAVLVEPVQSRRPALQPREFLHELRALTERHGIALIFDEVITGFRCHPGGAQAHFGIRADLATYGKVIGGGLPIGAIAGRAEYMNAFDGGPWSFGDDSFPEAAVTFFAGTFVRHPLALAAARAVLRHLAEQGPALQEAIAGNATEMIRRLNAAAAGSPFAAENFTSNWYVQTAPEFRFSGLLYALLRHRGIHIWEGRPCFVSTAHSAADIDQIVGAFAGSVAELEDAGFFSRGNAGTAPATTSEFPLNEAQQEIWLVCRQGGNASKAYNETWALLLDGALDAGALRDAAQTVIDRHESLRSTVCPSGETIAVAPTLTLEVPLHDLSTLSAAERDARLAELRTAEGTRTFDLERGPLVAVQLVRLAPERHALIFTAHHLVCDGWSCDVFLTELAALYSARHEGRPAQLPAPMSMRDYERFTRELQTTPEFAADLDYWLGQYRTIPPTLNLPGDRPYPRQRSFSGASVEMLLPAEFSQSLGRFGAQQGATLFSVLLAGFETLLFRLSGASDLAVGIPSAGQNLAGGDHLIGHCVNMLPLRATLRPEQTFAELLREVQATVLDAFEHQRVTFGQLLRRLSFSREPGRVPLIPVTFNVDPPLGHVHFAGLAHRLEANPRSAFQFDLGFNCDTTARGFRVICHFNTDLFDTETIRGWLGEYRALLESVSANPGQPLGASAAAAEPIEFWPSSPSAGGDPSYDDVLYNAMQLDQARHDAYRRAFAGTVGGKVVVDLGTGRDALLARMCIEAGARKVYAIELLADPAKKARALVERLGLADRIIVIHGRSQDVQLPELADVCVSENVGHIGGAEGGDLMLADGLRRFLKPGGIVIPGHCETRAAAVSLPDALRANPVFEPLGAYYAGQIWKLAGYRHDFRLCLTGMSRAHLCSTDDLFERVDFSAPEPSYERDVRLDITRDCRIDGLLLWLRLETVPGEVLESIDHPDSWLPVYLPLFDPPVEVRAGDRIEAKVRGQLAANGWNRDYAIAGKVHRQGGTSISFELDSPHYRELYRHTPFYDRLFGNDTIPVSSRGSAESQAPTSGDREKALVEWSGATRPFPADRGIHRLFEEQALRRPDAVAIAAAGVRVTYQELNERANRLARKLAALGVTRGACVGICSERSPAYLVGILAIAKAGGAYVPLDPKYPTERLAQMLAATGAAIVLVRSEIPAALAKSGVTVVAMESLDLAAGDPSNLAESGSGEALAYVMFTSGSTGTPKAVAIPHRAINRLVIGADYAPLTPSDVVAFASNVCFDATTFEIWGPLLNGGTVVVTPHDVMLSPAALRAHFDAHGVTAAFLTTSLFNRLANEMPAIFSHIRYLLCGGETADPQSVRRVLEHGRPQHLVHVYGPTETTTFATWHEVKSVAGSSVPIGRPIANTHVYLLDAQLRPVAIGETGEIHIGGPGLALGYLHQPEFTAERFVQTEFGRLYKSGDLARWLPGGELEFVGRADAQVKVRGFRIEPGEIEEALRHHPGVAEARVVVREHATVGKQLAAYVTARPGHAIQVGELRASLSQRLPDYMVPAAFSVLARLPLTANGKLDLRALPEPAPTGGPPGADAAPRNAVEISLAALWREVLGRDSLGIHDDFFLVGGHSLLAIRLLARIRETFHVDVHVGRLFETPTIAGLAEFVAEHLPTVTPGNAASLVMIQQGDAQRRPLYLVPGGWGGEIEFLVYAELVRNMDASLPLYGLRPRASNSDKLPEKTVEQFAARFVEDIRRFQPEGPYMLGGECVGGVVAYEMARQLEAAGQKVALLLLLDTEWPSEADLRLFNEWEAQRRQQEAETHRRTPGQHWAEARKHSPLGMLRYAWRHFRPDAVERQMAGFIAERECFVAWPRLLMNHALQPHTGRVTLLLDEISSRGSVLARWQQHHAGEIDVHVVTGDHTSYIREHASEAAAKIRELIELASQPAHAHRH